MSDREKDQRSGGAAPTKNSDGGGGEGGGLREAALRRRQLERRAAPDKPDAVATRAIREKGAGEPLQPRVQEKLGGAYGKDLGGVRVHNDPKSQAAADQAGAEAFTYGKDVFFGSGRYNPASEHGQFVLAHELAHVAQQGDHPEVQHKKIGAHGGQSGDPREQEADDLAHDALETGHSGDAQEEEASSAADLALSGGRAKLGRAPGRIRFFAQGDGTKNRGGHAYMTERALAGMGLDDSPGRDAQGTPDKPAETRVARMGNWERDLSQVMTPTTAGAINEIMPMLNIIALKDFGRGINMQSMGTYDPVEHLDNPTGLRGTDVLQQGDMTKSDSPSNDPKAIAAQSNNPDNAGSIAGKHDPGTPGGSAGKDDQAYADLDPRYQEKNGHEQRGKIMNPGDAAAFQVDESGIPRYINASKEWMTQTLRNSARLGRQQKVKGDENLHGPRLFASGTHTLQDYFAHSNFMEIGVNILLRQGGLKIADGGAAGPEGQPHTVDADQARGQRVLNTQAHANDAKGDPMEGNLAVGDPEKGAHEAGGDGDREVLTTGSFNLTDTVDSLLEEIGDHWKMLDPFKHKEDKPSPLTLACLDYMDMDKKNPTDFSAVGNSIGDKMHALVADIDKMAGGAEGALEGAGKLAGGAIKGAGELGGGATAGAAHLGGGAMHGLGGAADWAAQHTGGGKISGMLEGAAHKLTAGGDAVDKAGDQAGASIKGSAGNAAASVQGAADGGSAKIKEAVAKLGGLEAEFRGRQHTAKTMYQWMYEHGPLDELQDFLRPIPKVGPEAAGKVHSMQQEMHRMVNGILATAWNKILDGGVNQLNKVVGTIREKTNIQTKKKPAGGTGAAHKAKQFAANKFGNVSDMYDQATGKPKENKETGTLNGIAPGSYTPPSHTEVAKDHGEIENAGAKDATKGAADAKEEQGNWLSPIAQVLAAQATEAVGVPVAACWDVVDAGGTMGATDKRLDKIDQTVDEFFRHPQDSDFWRGPLTAAIGSKQLGPSLLEHLKSARASAPEKPSHATEIPANHPANQSKGDKDSDASPVPPPA